MSTPGLDPIKVIELPLSKSLLQRGDILFSFLPPEVQGNLSTVNSELGEDSQGLRQARIDFFQNKNEFNVGASATALRLWALRLSRAPGKWRILGFPGLFARPQDELLEILKTLGVRASLDEASLAMEVSPSVGSGESWPRFLNITPKVTSQILTGIFLTAWDLPHEVSLKIPKEFPSKSYFEMTLGLLSKLGIHFEKLPSDSESETLRVPAHLKMASLQAGDIEKFLSEKDMSAAFFSCLFVWVAKELGHQQFEVNLDVAEVKKSLQPDARGFKILKDHWGIDLWENKKNPKILNPKEIDISQNLDLYPVLVALGSLLNQKIQWVGTENLAFKESHRLQRVDELLKTSLNGGMFDPRPDHRLAMAASLLLVGGRKFQTGHTEVLRKSFPQFEPHLKVLIGASQ